MVTRMNCCGARYGQLGHPETKILRNQPVSRSFIEYFRDKYDFSFVFLKEFMYLLDKSNLNPVRLPVGHVTIPLENYLLPMKVDCLLQIGLTFQDLS